MTVHSQMIAISSSLCRIILWLTRRGSGRKMTPLVRSETTQKMTAGLNRRSFCAHTGVTRIEVRYCYQEIMFICAFLSITQAAIQECHDLGATADCVGAEHCALSVCTQSNAVFHSPQYCRLVVASLDHIREGHFSALGGRAS